MRSRLARPFGIEGFVIAARYGILLILHSRRDIETGFSSTVSLSLDGGRQYRRYTIARGSSFYARSSSRSVGKEHLRRG